MGIRVSKVAVLASIVMIFGFGTCRKEGIGGCADAVYSFRMNVQAYPDKDSMQIGDTLWLEVNSASTFTDQNSNTSVDYSGAVNLGTAIGFGQFLGIDSSKDAANSFSYVLISGSSVQNPFTEKIREYLFSETRDRYIFKLGIIPQYRGTFGLGLSNAANIYRTGDKCTKALFEVDFANTNQHYYLNPNIMNSNEDTLSPSGSYNFKVF